MSDSGPRGVSSPAPTSALPGSPRSADWVWLGRIHFDATAVLQENLRAAILRGEPCETLLLCEHTPVVTLGRRARPEHLLAAPAELARLGVDVRSASRGGEVTYHGPGQLVAYPVLRLRRGVLAHVEGMATAVIALLRELGVHGQWRREQPGVFVDDAKICAFGIHVRRGVAIHGLALNVTLPKESFAPIVPCGRPGGMVTSVHEQASVSAMSRGSGVSPAALAEPLARHLAQSLGLRFCPQAADALAQFRDCKSEIGTDSMGGK